MLDLLHLLPLTDALRADCKDLRETAIARDCAIVKLMIRAGLCTEQDFVDELARQRAIIDQLVAAKRDEKPD